MDQAESELRALLPMGTLAFEPLEFGWEGVKRAFIFSSQFNATSFDAWASMFVQNVKYCIPPSVKIFVETHSDLGYLVINVYTENKIDIHAAWCEKKDAFLNLHAWLGSHRLRELVEQTCPQTAGVIRVEDPFAFYPKDLGDVG